MPKRKEYKYKKRTPESVRRRAEQQSGSYDRLFKDDLETFAPKEGSYQLRILPPGWDDAEHYGYEIFVHYSVGPDNGQYLCPAKHNIGVCPICEERQGITDDKERRELQATKRVLVWLIDRDHEDRGPLLWIMPWTVDRDINQQALDPRTGEVLYIDDPEEGYDISFTREGSGIQTKYSGLKILHRPTELAKNDDDLNDWLDYIEDHALPECLNIFDGKYIEKIFAGAGTATSEDEEEEEEEIEEEQEEENPRRRSRRQSPPEEKTPESNDEEGDSKETDQSEALKKLRGIRRRRRNEDD